jgi:hypothetical protein
MGQKPPAGNAIRIAAAALAACLAVACTVACTDSRADRTSRDAGLPREAPVFGVDMIYQDAPHVLIRAFADPALGGDLTRLLRDRVGLGAVRINSFGFYSFLGPERSAELRRETQQGNIFPWFPIEGAIRWVRASGLRVVAGVNPEDGPEAAVALVERYRAAGALEQILAIEIGNEPHLSKRPWQPEEYAEAAAAIVRALEPYGVPVAVSLTVGSEAKTPTGISDDDYTRRELETLDRLLGLGERDDVYGVVHLYAGGVDPGAVDRLDELVRPYAPRMRFLVTEYNIRSRLRENQQLTPEYGLEHIAKTSRLVAHPKVAGLFVHGVPYHSIVYWSGDSGVQTVSGFRDPRLRGEALAPGWHLTPAGEGLALCARELWRGELVDYEESDEVQIWSTLLPGGEARVGVINVSGWAVERRVEIGRATLDVHVDGRSIAVFSSTGEVGRVAF